MDEQNGHIFGAAMLACTELERRFVLAMAANPFSNASQWARDAGYSDAGGACKVRGHFLLQHPRVVAAVQEFARTHIDTVGPILATSGLLRIARDKKHPRHFQALTALANRVGFHETTEHKVSVEHTDRTGRAMAKRIKELADALGMDAAQLLGVNEVEPVKVIEGKVDASTDGQD